MSRLMTSALCLFVATQAWAAGPGDALSVVDPWVRLPAPGAKNTGAFMVIKNSGKVDRKLVEASNPASKVTELHTHLNEGGVMKMRQIPFIEVKANGEAELKPGSLHVMLIDLTAALKEGETIAITLKFDDGTTKVVKAPVRKFDMPSPPAPGTPPSH
jgi:periplasmic copper chaperone A